MPYPQHTLAVGVLKESTLVLVEMSTRIDTGFAGSPFSTSQKSSTETSVLQVFVELGFSIISEAR